MTRTTRTTRRTTRAAMIRQWCGLGLTAGVALSPRLWGLGPREFPRVPVAGPPLPAVVEAVLALALLAGVLASPWRPRLRWAAGVAALALAWADQQRWQPWAWEYLLIGVLANGEPLAARLILGGVVAWAGFWKLGPGYQDGVAAWLASPLPQDLKWTARVVPYFELATGAGLLAGWRPIRGAVRAAVVTMHASALALLVWRGWNSVVWPWQIASAVIAWHALGPEGDWRTLSRRRGAAPAPTSSPAAGWGRLLPRVRPSVPAWIAVALAVLLPMGWPLGVVNMYLAWRLYADSVASDDDLQLWSLRELNVPISPAPWRVRQHLGGRGPTGPAGIDAARFPLPTGDPVISLVSSGPRGSGRTLGS